jgi:TolB-like protein/DNA-binding winged helix-turn-helix (wHTH) protein/Tfp pilus assembly protein PilF
MTQLSNPERIRFDAFEIDLSSGELRKHGIKIKLHDQPFKVLALLVEHPGEVITREKLYETLWPAGTFVDSDMGLNSAMMKLRDALGDSAEHPRFVETLPRRGYRLIVPVERQFPNRTDGIAVTAALPAVLPSPENWSGPALPPPVAGLEATQVQRAAAASAESPRAGSLGFKIAAAALVLLGVAAGFWWHFRAAPGPYSIAVLPLKNLSEDRSTDYFSDGLTDEIINNLSMIDGLEVKARTSSFTFRDKTQDVRVVGEELGANLVMEGSVLRAGEKLRVDVHLIRASDQALLWSGRYDREMKDIFEIQDEISLSIVNELRLNLGRGQRRYNTNMQAYDLYLKAEALSNQTPGVDSETIASSIPLFEQAIAKDPNFAPAYAGIANAYAYLSATPRTFSPELAFTKMSDACQKAMELDPLLAEAYACMGLVNTRNNEWADAERAFRRSLELNPNQARPRQDFALWVLFPSGKQAEAISQMRAAFALDPLSSKSSNALSFVLMNVEGYDEVIANSKRTLAVNPEDYSSQQLMGRAFVQRGQVDEGISIFERLGHGSEAFLGYAYAKAGRREEAVRLIRQFPKFPWVQAIVSGGLQDKDGAIKGLEKMVAIKDPRTGIYLTIPELAILHGDPRTAKIRAELGLNQKR